ncbi:MAG TPA: thiamine phosphate synthase [Nocardioidaceae bacterium]|nr:thiamine phosphate synthase [Nocardioidaceae bacterium]
MTLPPLLMLTDRHQLPPGHALREQVARAVEAGVRAVILRERDLDDRARTELARDLARVLTGAGGQLILAAPRLGLPHGVHLRADDPPPRERPAVVGRSCHSEDEVRRARAEGVDFVLLGPVATTSSKPGYGPPLGMAGLRELTAAHPSRDASMMQPRIYALGGVDASNAADWIAAGADGVAVMGALMRADDPGRVTSDLLSALPTAEVPA